MGESETALLTLTRVLSSPHTAAFAIEAQVVCVEVLLAAGRPAEAVVHAHSAMRGADNLGGPLLLGAAYRAAGQVAAAQGDHAAAAAYFQAAAQHFENARAPHEHERLRAEMQEIEGLVR
jgi:hypothetical protein